MRGLLCACLCGLASQALGQCAESEEACLLATRARVELEDDAAKSAHRRRHQSNGHRRRRMSNSGAYDLFMESYDEIAVFNEGMGYLKSFVSYAISLIPYVGPLFSLLVNAFWGEKGDHDKALIEAIQKWTTRYVGSAITKTLHEQMQGKFQAMRQGFKSYKQCKSHVEEKTTAALERQIEKCDNTLVTLCSGSEGALSLVNASSYRGRLMSDYVMAATIKLSLWRERYDAAAYYKNKTNTSSSLFPSTKEALERMKEHYERIEEDLASMVPEWSSWRWDSIDIKDESYTSMRRRVGERCSAFKLEDDVRPEYDQDFDNIKCQVARWRVKFSEMVPILKMFTGLHQLIPGEELQPLRHGKVLPKVLSLGPFSAWINGDAQMTEQNQNRMAYPNKEIPHTEFLRWASLDSVRKAAQLDQLTFYSSRKAVRVLRLPETSTGGDTTLLMSLPYDQCGLHLGYRSGRLQSWISFEIKNLTKVWAGTDNSHGYFNSGAFVCGLYKFRQITQIRSNAYSTGDAFMVSFQFFPGEAQR
ncbi:unnamed protein product [Effrenium voratum]|uniref:Pesticidal crystal protein domain-containing protein n=1 Tax=Effrenium voratum TaxID=2562239 RepID=A0AA36JJL6_9DINO|nr:unnamed protein product [Effrenium voratum]CAJ1428032.1 unnamed protein product [Effrenium voratum]